MVGLSPRGREYCALCPKQPSLRRSQSAARLPGLRLGRPSVVSPDLQAPLSGPSRSSRASGQAQRAPCSFRREVVSRMRTLGRVMHRRITAILQMQHIACPLRDDKRSKAMASRSNPLSGAILSSQEWAQSWLFLRSFTLYIK